MAPKARRSKAVVPALPVALKTFKAHHVLNRRLMHGWDPRSRVGYSYYKHQGLSKQTAKKVAVYLLHCPIEERADWWERMSNFGTTPTNFTKVIEEYQHESARLLSKHQLRIRPRAKVSRMLSVCIPELQMQAESYIEQIVRRPGPKHM